MRVMKRCYLQAGRILPLKVVRGSAYVDAGTRVHRTVQGVHPLEYPETFVIEVGKDERASGTQDPDHLI
jgi:hypothetical protein